MDGLGSCRVDKSMRGGVNHRPKISYALFALEDLIIPIPVFLSDGYQLLLFVVSSQDILLVHARASDYSHRGSILS